MLTVTILATTACGGSEPLGVREPPVGSVTVTAPAAPLLLGETTQLTATIRAADGSVLTGRPVAWTSSDEAVASVAAGGSVFGRGLGAAFVRAASEGKADSVQVTVLAPKVGNATYVLTAVEAQPLPFLMTDYTTPDGYRQRRWVVSDTLRFLESGNVPNTRVERFAEQEPGGQEQVYDMILAGGGFFEQVDDVVAVAWTWITPPPADAPRDTLRLRHDGLVRRVAVPPACPQCAPGPVVEFLYVRQAPQVEAGA